ncbi:MAG TPA: hypothetical protein VHB51_02960 [Candidatus Saccharimonadales bacterium]|nr:hypothetical protein [Candidatus Saccharimonadales bacterium]
MYSGSTFTSFSGRLLGAHQKINRQARHHLERLAPQALFPDVRTILHFEGGNGPDAIKRKSPAINEPWHYLRPFDRGDTQLIKLVEQHYKDLVKALKNKDDIRSAFEAAWLAHAIVDGLTPAHHYPYEEKLVELSNGRDIKERTTLWKKLFMPGTSILQFFRNNWQMWGPKGLFTTHSGFECGTAMLIAPLKARHTAPTDDFVAKFEKQSLDQWFRGLAQDVAKLELYDAFYTNGWTIDLARRVRNELAPVLVQAVSLVWYGAVRDAGLLQGV